MGRNIKYIFIILVMCMFVNELHAQSGGDQIIGIYLMKTPDTGDESRIEIYKTQNGTYAGKVIWVKNPHNEDGTLRRDVKNPDPKLRNRTADNMIILKNLKYDSDNQEWIEGDIYNPNMGKSFKLKVKKMKNPDEIIVRYYKGIPFAGMDNTWKKLK